MKTFLRIAGGIVLVVLALAVGAVSWLAIRKPAARPVSSARIEPTPERLARGKYVVENVADCLNCHSDHLLTFGVPVKPGTEGQGGFTFNKDFGVPGVVTAPNITPDREFGVGEWSDDEIMRAFREGVDRKGDALFPMMPYEHLAHMSDDDAKSVVVYLRTLKPIRHSVPKKSIDFPVNLFVKFVPKPITSPVPHPDQTKSVEYGGYLARISGCIECHTPHDDKGKLIEARLFSGGWTMIGPWGRNVTPNLTPAKESFIARASRDEFIGRFKAFRGMNAANAPAVPPGRNTIMPWLTFARMDEKDLGAIYDYLRTLQPIENKVNPFPDAKVN